jgi:hypothetical protein
MPGDERRRQKAYLDRCQSVMRWIQRYVPEFEKRWNRFARPAGPSWLRALSTRKSTSGTLTVVNWLPLLKWRKINYAFIEPLYEDRRILKEVGDDVGQTAIKLPLNSICGKTAQSVGEDDKPPPSACPYYAAATTAHCRRKLIEAALIDPNTIVFFATDGIVSERKLEGLPRVKIPGKARVDLGDWEYAQADPYVRWCGRGGAARLPPIPVFGARLKSRQCADSSGAGGGTDIVEAA